MNFETIKENKKLLLTLAVPLSVSLAIAVVLYIFLSNFSAVGSAISAFIGYFEAVIIGAVIAYLINPVAKFFDRTIFKKVGKEGLRWILAVVLAIITTVFFLVLLIGIMMPQLIGSILSFASNIDKYAASLLDIVKGLPLKEYGITVKLDSLPSIYENIMKSISGFLIENRFNIIHVASGTGKGIFTWFLAIVMSIYFLTSKKAVKAWWIRLLRAVCVPSKADGIIDYLVKCDNIMVHYVIYSILEGILIGVITGIFMLIMGMPYAGLVAVVVGVTNMIPTFGPIIGEVAAFFVMVMVNPIHAVILFAFIWTLQLFDGYVLKPKLFGGSLGVSGVFILIMSIVGANMFGFFGMLLAIPAAAVLDMTYREYLLPGLERRMKKKMQKSI